MYCYTKNIGLSCVFNELQLWTHISEDHPIFLKTVASLSNIDLPNNLKQELDNIHNEFSKLHSRVMYLKKTVNRSPYLHPQQINVINKAINQFLVYDKHALFTYPKLAHYGQDNAVWQELIKHIIDEQYFMMELFKDLKKQLRF